MQQPLTGEAGSRVGVGFARPALLVDVLRAAALDDADDNEDKKDNAASSSESARYG